jgi:tetratricopeptide (TPR) repeat protein
MRLLEAGRLIMVSALGWGLLACSHSSEPPRTSSLGVKVAVADEQTLAEARRLFDEGNAGLALVRVEAYLSFNPNSASGHNLAGAIFDRLGRYDLAQGHYEKALAQQADYLPAINNFGLSKLQRARASARPELELEADALLARALELSGDPAELANSHAALRAALMPRKAPEAKAPARLPRTAWLERRSEHFSVLVTKPAFAGPTLAELDLDPAIALVSPGATFKTTHFAIAPSRARRIRTWGSIGEAAPRLFGATSSLSILTLKAPRKPRWYNTFASIRFPADFALRARAAALLKLAGLP